MSKTIFKLEPFTRFLARVVELNRLHAPEDELHAALLHEATTVVPGARTAVGSHTDAAWARKLLATIHKEFPAGAPLEEQAAFLVRAFAGLRPFGEANFRTGWDYLVGLFEHHAHPMMVSEEDARSLGADLWERMEGAYPKGLPRGALLDRDAVFEFLTGWFRPRIG